MWSWTGSRVAWRLKSSHSEASVEGGFTLLEVLVAFTILAVVMGAVLQAFSTGLHGIRDSEAYRIALLHAQSKLEEIGITMPLEGGEQTGEFDNGFRWTSRISPKVEAGENQARDLSMVAYEVELEVSWHEGDGGRSVVMKTVRMGPAR